MNKYFGLFFRYDSYDFPRKFLQISDESLKTLLFRGKRLIILLCFSDLPVIIGMGDDMNGKWRKLTQWGVSVFWGASLFSVIFCVGYNAILEYSLAHISSPEESSPQSSDLVSEESSDSNLPEFPIFDENHLPIISDTKYITNILLIGTDARISGEYCRSDTMLLVSVNRKTQKLTTCSFLRDLYVSIDGYEENRLNTAYSHGGADLLLSTLRSNYNLDVTYYVTVDFSSFADIIDSFGGVTLEISEKEAAVMNGIIKEMNGSLGLHTPLVPVNGGVLCLDGYQALAYARDRSSPNGDFDRTARQRILIDTLLNNLKESSPLQLFSILHGLLPYVSTNIPLSVLKELVSELPSYQSYRTVSTSFPSNGAFSYETVRGMAVIFPDVEGNLRRLYEIIYF